MQEGVCGKPTARGSTTPYRRAAVPRLYVGVIVCSPFFTGTLPLKLSTNRFYHLSKRARLVPIDSGNVSFQPVETIIVDVTVRESKWGDISRALLDGLHVSIGLCPSSQIASAPGSNSSMP